MSTRSRDFGSGHLRIPPPLRLANAGVIYAFLMLVLVLTSFSQLQGRPFFLAPTNVSNILDQTSLIGIIAIFTTIVLISGNFDLSVGSVAALGAAVCLSVVPTVGVPLAILISVAAGAAVGLLNGVIVQYIGINAFIVTLGTMTAIRGLVLILTRGRTITLSDEDTKHSLQSIDQSYWTTPNLYLLGGAGLLILAGIRALAARHNTGTLRSVRVLGPGIAGLVLSIVALVVPNAIFTVALSPRTMYMIVLGGGASLVLRYTVVGRRLYATGGNTEAARLSGIAVNRYKVLAFVCNGAAAAFAGVLYASRLGSINPTGLTGFELTALAAAILGGTSLFGGLGTVGKSLVGALILFTLQNGFNILNLGANWQGLIEGAVLIIAAGIYTVSNRNGSSRHIRNSDVPDGSLARPLERGTSDATQRQPADVG
jgi:D-xylose transport system permease protein